MSIEDEAAGDSGSSTESEFYEGVDYEARNIYMNASPSDADRAKTDESRTGGTIECLHGSASGRRTVKNEKQASNSKAQSIDRLTHAPATSKAAKEPESRQSHDQTDTSLDSDASRNIVAVNAQSQPPSLNRKLVCTQCCASVDALSHPTAFQRVHRLCHCCKVAFGDSKHGIVHTNATRVHVRFCSPCFEKNGQILMAKIKISKPPLVITCSGCHQANPSREFHKRQQIFRAWEELLDEKHFCLECLPTGFVEVEDNIMPLELTCVKCNYEKLRNSFIRTLKEHATIFHDLDQFQHWVDGALLVCEKCILLGERNDLHLPCSRCKQLLPRMKFSRDQRVIAREYDENPDQLECKPIHTCLSCIAALQRKRTDYQDEDARSMIRGKSRRQAVDSRRSSRELDDMYDSCDRNQKRRRSNDSRGPSHPYSYERSHRDHSATRPHRLDNNRRDYRRSKCSFARHDGQSSSYHKQY